MIRILAAALLSLTFALAIAQANPPSPSSAIGAQDKQGLAGQGKNESANDQGGTASSPIVVKLLPTQQSQQKTTNDANDREQKEAEERLAVISNLLLVLFNGVLAVCTIALFVVTRKTANAAEMNARAVIGLEIPILRARLAELTSLREPMPEKGSFSGGIDSYPPGKHSAVGHIEFINYGRTPAFPVKFDAGWMVSERLPAEPVYLKSCDIPHAAVIRPDDDYTIDACFGINITEAEVAVCRAEKAWLWFYGKLSYTDFLGMDREAKFCWRFKNYNADFGSVSFGFASDGNPPAAYIR